MGVNFTASSTTVTISGAIAVGATALGSTQTLVSQTDIASHAYVDGVEFTTIDYTVTAAKTLYISQFYGSFSSYFAGAGEVRLYVDGTLRAALWVERMTTSAVGDRHHNFPFPSPISAAAGTHVVIKVYPTQTITQPCFRTGFIGFEQ